MVDNIPQDDVRNWNVINYAKDIRSKLDYLEDGFKRELCGISNIAAHIIETLKNEDSSTDLTLNAIKTLKTFPNISALNFMLEYEPELLGTWVKFKLLAT